MREVRSLEFPIHASIDTQADSTARKRKDAELCSSEARLRYVLAVIREGVWDCDMAAGKVSHSRRWCEMLGLDDLRLEQPLQAFFDLIHPDDRAEVHQQFAAMHAQSEEFFGEYRLRHTDGSYIRVADHGLVVAREPNKRPSRIVGAITDITAHRKDQEEAIRSKEQLRALAGWLRAMREEDRTRIAREIHDELGQMLTGLMLDLAWLGKRIAKVEDTQLQFEMSNKLVDIKALTGTMIHTVREIVSDMRPQALDNLGLGPAINFEADRFQQRTGIACITDVPLDTMDLPPEVATGLFRIVQEALTNVARHAQATYVNIRLTRQEEGIVLTVRDNGRGITQDEIDDVRSLGLFGMRERAIQMSASFTVDGQPGRGTTVTVRLP
jgi:two-component system sensor histidine kinase UhpB